MKWTLIFLAAALALVYFGMTTVSERQGNAGEPVEAVATTDAAEMLERLGPAPASSATVQKPVATEYVSGCILTATTCRCIDKRGKSLELTREDCKGVLGVGPK